MSYAKATKARYPRVDLSRNIPGDRAKTVFRGEAVLQDIDQKEKGAHRHGDGPLEELLDKVAIYHKLSLPELYSGSRRKVVSMT
ncbi:MAG: hypothetical protein KGZ93_04095 [Actinobacteria bacterium]|nr:hypothetical protein [Actinomycetota bacterium]